ncbi:NAD(P)-binding domain-containing protein [Acuticoccus sp. MNP-M23]|uniref:NAD(P)-binding domain-containing protein n=1 Tax=Acuticoccus sp. MNP-M23 TaxID=3072793 RepID=UPI002815215D|nr:NAD(P)-binding domain-containing protein [Acuticoccus sp. MNP-M23]WMS43235.1 NAD(P)-binding domain-containing protein [Acuticoccus sp. MNP-M23]
MQNEADTVVDLLVVGAGWAGLYAAKYARSAGLSVTILEARDDLGGVWNYSDDPETITVMKTTVSSSSRHVTEASDLAMDDAAGNFFRHEDALLYLRRYADRFGLTPLIVTGARVAGTFKAGGVWQVRTVDGRLFRAERLAVCTGVHQARRPITGPASTFAGTCLHAGDVKDVAALALTDGDHVVVYGGGETAADIVQDVATTTEAQITWAIRGGQHFFRKAPLRRGRPPGHYDRDDMALDEYSSALIGLVSPPEAGKKGMRHRCNVATSGSPFAYQGHGIAEWCNDLPWFRQFFNKNAHALEHVWNGRVTPARAIEDCDGTTPVFEGGARARATHLICCFGYEGDVSFLPDEVRAVPTDRLHRLVFHPDDPSLSFFGFARPTILSLPYMIELQCLYAARVWSGELGLPGRQALRQEADADAAALGEYFGYERSNRNIVCPFWYTQRMLRIIGEEKSEARVLFKRFHPLRNWGDFSRIIRMPLSPLLLRLLLAGSGPDERARIGQYLSPMPFGFRRQPRVSLLRYVLAFTVAIGLPRVIGLDAIFDRIAKRRMARHGRAIALRRSPARATAPAVPSAGYQTFRTDVGRPSGAPSVAAPARSGAQRQGL